MSIPTIRFPMFIGFTARCLAATLSTVLTACATQTPTQAQAAHVSTPPGPAGLPVELRKPAPIRTAIAPARAEVPVTTTSSVTTPIISTAIEPSPIPDPSAVAEDKMATLQLWVDQQDRLYRVAAPLLINNTELCPRHSRNLLGLTAKTKYSYSENFAAAAQAVLGLDEHLRVMSILPGSGAALAGIQKKDILATAGIEPIPSGPEAERTAASLIGAEMQGRASLDLSVERNDARIALQVPLTPACAMTIDLGNTENVSSYADGNRVMITRGMLEFVQSDEELAYVLAKEIAHNILTPSTRMDMASIIDGLHTLSAPSSSAKLDAGLAPFTPVLDATADKLALYLLARAGYGLDNVQAFWKRLADAYPATIARSYTALHPSTDYRLSVIGQIAQTIALKRKNNLPLVP